MHLLNLKRVLTFLLGAVILFSFTACNLAIASSLNNPKEKTEDLTAEGSSKLTVANTHFAMKLFKELAKHNEGKNLFISPASVSLALSMTLNGANGTTLEAMTKTLGFENMTLEQINQGNAALMSILKKPDSKVELSIANSIWSRKGLSFNKSFLEANRKYYGAEIRQLNFSSIEAAKTINNWVKGKTRNKIEKIVEPPIDPQTIMFLINAIYFKGSWAKEFDEKATSERTFYLQDGTEKQHPMMSQAGRYRYYSEEEGLQAVYLPYGTGKIGMYVFLPEKGRKLEDFCNQLTIDQWSKWMDGFKEAEGEIVLPRFKFEYETTLNDVLKAMAMDIAFDPDKADFSAMRPSSKSESLYISNVKHKSFVDVNEKGTEAAAVTSVEIRTTSALITDRFEMVADHPFFFVIRDEQTGTILFMGTVMNP